MPQSASAGPTVEGIVNYIAPMQVRPRFYAQDHSRDNLVLESRTIEITDARKAATPPSLTEQGFELVALPSAVTDYRDAEQVKQIYAEEIRQLLLRLTGASSIVITGGGVLRFGEKSAEAGTLLNSFPARFVHIDVSDPTAAAFAARSLPENEGDLAGKRRFAHYNIWKVLSAPPQDVPLAVCEAGSLAADDLVPADAVFDAKDQPEWSFEGLVVRYSPRHRWSYFSGMTPDEALVFKTYDSDPDQPHHVPHSAFDDPTCPPGVTPRCSIEMRAIAYFDAN